MLTRVRRSKSSPAGAQSVSVRADHRLVLWGRAVIGPELQVEITRMQPVERLFDSARPIPARNEYGGIALTFG